VATGSDGKATSTLTLTGSYTDDTVVNIAAELNALLRATGALTFEIQTWRPNFKDAQHSPGVAERGGLRSSPGILTVLDRPQAPPAGPDRAENWKPLPNLHLTPTVGKVTNNGFQADPTLGTVSPSATVKTDANGQIKVTFTATAGASPADGALVVVVFRDARSAGPSSQNALGYILFAQSSTDSSSRSAPPPYDYHVSTTINYKNSAADGTVSAAFAAALADWDNVKDALGVDHFSFASVANAHTSTPPGFEVFANLPATWIERNSEARASFASTELNVQAYNKMLFCLEALKPDPTYHSVVTGNENVGRSLEWTPPTGSGVGSFFYLTASHEIGHILGLGHHKKVDGQRSLMALWRDPTPTLDGGDGSGAFPFYVNNVTTPSQTDKLYVNTFSYP